MTTHVMTIPQVYPLVQSLESSIETTTAVLCPPAPPTGQPASGAQAEEEKKGGGKAAKGGKDKGGKVWTHLSMWHCM